jgi:hypothetical protein
MAMNANRRAIAAALAAVMEPEGWRVSIDPRSVNPPCVLVGAPDALDPAPCGWSGMVPIWVLVPGPGNLDALDALLDGLELARTAARVTITEPARADTYYTDPTGDTGLPGYVYGAVLTS